MMFLNVGTLDTDRRNEQGVLGGCFLDRYSRPLSAHFFAMLKVHPYF